VTWMRRAVGLLLALTLLAACSGTAEPDDPADSTPAAEGPASSAPSAPQTTGPDPESTPALPEVHHPVSLPALMREDFRASRIRQQRVIEETDAYTRSVVTYDSGGVTVSGVLLRPQGRGPFPGIVLNHGYIDPPFYAPGQGLAREQDWLARAGFVVLHTDYRGHAGSDPATPLDRETRLGYTRDAIHAVLALEREPYVDPDRMAMLGRSMGGGVTLNALVVYPDLVEAAVVYASVSSRYLDNLRHFTAPNRPDAVRAVFDRFGTPDESPRFYRELSSRTFFDLSVSLGDHHAAAAGGGRRRQPARGLPRGAPHVRPAVAGLDRADGAVPDAAPGGVTFGPDRRIRPGVA